MAARPTTHDGPHRPDRPARRPDASTSPLPYPDDLTHRAPSAIDDGDDMRARIIDDDPHVVRLLQRLLLDDPGGSSVETRVVTAATLTGALVLLDQQPIDVVLTAADLPDGRGPEVVGPLIARRPHLPVLVHTDDPDNGIDKEVQRIPAEIWRMNENKFTKVFAKEKLVESIVIDPYRETADVDVEDNHWPAYTEKSRFELFKQKQAPRGSSTGNNPMQEARN